MSDYLRGLMQIALAILLGLATIMAAWACFALMSRWWGDLSNSHSPACLRSHDEYHSQVTRICDEYARG